MYINVILLYLCFIVYVVPPVVYIEGSQTVLTALEHGTFQLSFEVLAAHPPVETSGITWRFNDVISLNDLSSLHGAELSFSADRRTLTITNINYNISGRYFLSAFNGAGRGSNFIYLNVEGKHVHIIIVCVCVCIYTHTHTYIYIYIYIIHSCIYIHSTTN